MKNPGICRGFCNGSTGWNRTADLRLMKPLMEWTGHGKNRQKCINVSGEIAGNCMLVAMMLPRGELAYGAQKDQSGRHR